MERKVSKIDKALADLKAAIQCDHKFEFLHDHAFDNGVVGRCSVCRCRVTSWPGSVHYDEIVAAKPVQ